MSAFITCHSQHYNMLNNILIPLGAILQHIHTCLSRNEERKTYNSLRILILCFTNGAIRIFCSLKSDEKHSKTLYCKYIVSILGIDYVIEKIYR